ncbi:hypothetical protein WH47_06381 [Habropoda laboriosa]|uniref:Uncharacterized protein n=1 Tax=Habropoda laboriosa TaxID=597456 RepID=A0A0L7RCQ6_9HYME|nr:hypothetical protein WH47_06381 [Habropoda laboriosa]
MLRYTRVLYPGKAVVPVGEMEHEAQEARSIGVQGAFASNSMHYTSLSTHATTLCSGKRHLQASVTCWIEYFLIPRD